MENFLEFLRIALLYSCLVALLYCLIRLCTLCHGWKDIREQEKIDCLVVYEQDYIPRYIPLCKIDDFVFNKKNKTIEVNMKGGDAITVTHHSRFEIKKVETKYIK